MLLLFHDVLGFALARPIFAIGQGKGALSPLILATGVAAVINLILNMLLIPEYAMVGAAVATSIGYGSMLLLHIIAARRIGYNPVSDLRLVRVSVTAVIAGGIIFGLSTMLGPTILSLIIVPPVGLLVYTIFALRTRAVDVEELFVFTGYLPTLVQ